MAKRKAAVANDGVVSAKSAKTADGQTASFKNKEKVLVLGSRGITFRFRHLMMDLVQLLPHCKKDAKLDTKSERGVLNEVAEMRGCSSVLFFEARKKKDLYCWLAKTPNGPTAKFLVSNIHTMAELKLSGNHLKGSRPVLSFHATFDEQPHWQLLKEMFMQTFATPLKYSKSKPFFDHVISFSIADERVWIRNYQVVVPTAKGSKEDMVLVEVGPRCCLQIVKIFAGGFGGQTLYENPQYVSPNALRSMMKKQASKKYATRVKAHQKRRTHVAENQPPKDELGDVFKE